LVGAAGFEPSTPSPLDFNLAFSNNFRLVHKSAIVLARQWFFAAYHFTCGLAEFLGIFKCPRKIICSFPNRPRKIFKFLQLSKRLRPPNFCPNSWFDLSGAGDELDTDSLLHLRSGLWRAPLSHAAVRLRHRAGMHGQWQCVAEPKSQPDADGCELRLQLRHTPEGVPPPY